MRKLCIGFSWESVIFTKVFTKHNEFFPRFHYTVNKRILHAREKYVICSIWYHCNPKQNLRHFNIITSSKTSRLKADIIYSTTIAHRTARRTKCPKNTDRPQERSNSWTSDLHPRSKGRCYPKWAIEADFIKNLALKHLSYFLKGIRALSSQWKISKVGK